MSQIIDQIPAAAGGLNYDDDPRFFEKGDTDYRLNVIPSALGDTYVLTNMKGTTKKSHSFTHDAAYAGAAYTSLGACYDITRNAVYFFIYSDLTNHCILRYNIDDDDFDKIVWDNPNIGLDSDYEITDAFMIDNWLYWNPRSSSPRAINVQWAYYDYVSYRLPSNVAVGQYAKDNWNKVYLCIQAWTAGAGEPYENTDYFTFVDWCYNDVYPIGDASAGFLYRERGFFNTPYNVLAPIQYSIEDADPLVDFNNIRGNVFQFSYRYYVPELGYSVSAPFTQVLGTFSDESYNGEFSGQPSWDNQIDLTVNPPQINSDESENDFLFEHVELLVRTADDSNWRTVYKIPHSNFITDGSGTVVHSFLNDKGLSVADSAAIETPYNFLPRTATSQAAIDGERVGYGQVKEGFDTPPIDVDLTYDLEQVEYSQTGVTGAAAQVISFTEVKDYSTNDPDEEPYYNYTTAALTTGAFATHILRAIVNGREYFYTLVDADDDTDADYAAAVVKVLELGGIGASVFSTSRVQTEYFPTPQSISVERYTTAAANVLEPSIKHRTLKSGAWHAYCLYYRDPLLRRTEAIPIDPVYVGFLPEELFKPGLNTGTGYIRKLNYEINHDAPEWASWWSFGYAGNTSIAKFWQYNIAAAGVVDDAASEYDDLSYVDISPLQGIRDDATLDLNFNNSNIDSYEFVEGDRIRFLTKEEDAATGNATLSIDDWSLTAHDYEIRAFDPTNNYIYFDSYSVVTETDVIGAAYSDPSVIVELYRPKKTGNDVVYYEIGGWKPVTGAGPAKVHQDATGTLDEGDCYLITRTLSKQPTATWAAVEDPVFVESFSWSDFYESEMWSKGKAGFSFGLGEKTLNNIRYSNKLSKNTLSSGVGVFDGLDYKTLSYNYGDITAIRQIGGVFKVIFENNVASVLVNRTQFYDADGQSQIVKSDDVLGSVNYSEESWGSVNPESVLVVDRNLYFFDLRRKAYVRNASNGSFPISDYKMAKYFIDKSDNLISSGESNFSVYSAWDDDRGLVMVGINDSVDTTNSEIVLFHEASNRWVGFMSARSLTQTDLIQIANDTLGTTPDFTIATTVDAGVYTSIVQVINGTIGGATGTYNDNAAFNTSDTITLQEGDSIALSFENVSGSSQDMDESVEVRIVGTGDVDSLTFSVSDYAGTPYTDSITITQASAIQVSFAVNGNFTVAADDFTAVDWSISITSNNTPLLHGNSSGLFSFTDEDIWLHSDSATYCNFWGTQQTYLARVYSVENPTIIKIFETMAVHGNERWDVTDIQIPASLNYPYGMQSKIPAARFEKEEGVLRSDYLCNMKSSSSTANIPDLLNGDNLRGYYLYHDLEGSETTKHVLYKVDVLSTPSKY